jgi:2'-5' RNA ligase
VSAQPGDRRPGGSPGRPAPALDLPTMSLPIQPDPEAKTIGVAIDIPSPWGEELQNWRAEFGDPMAKAIPPHITLVPPTALHAAQLDGVLEHLAKVAASTRSFWVTLRSTDTFRPVSPVVFVVVRRGISGCDALQQRVRTGPLRRDLKFPYHPHVTVAHDLDDDALDRALATLKDFQARFEVAKFGLYLHGSDGVWRRQHEFVCSGGAGGAALSPPSLSPGGASGR